MADLYKGIAGSPITYLTADISADQTTISIADDSALPDAPNICTIGYGEHLETIKYETKSNGVLQNVTRGIEGIPRAWPAGTEVARFFTAYDHNSIIENFNSHLADYAKEATEFTIESDSIYQRTNCVYYKKNGFVFLVLGSIQKKDGSEFAIGEYIATLPVGFRPKQNLYVQGMAQTGSIRNPISLIVYRSGEVQMGQTSSDTFIRLSVSYYAGGGTV